MIQVRRIYQNSNRFPAITEITHTDITEDSSAEQENNPRLLLHDVRRRPVHPDHEKEEVAQEWYEGPHCLLERAHFTRFVLVRPENNLFRFDLLTLLFEYSQ